MLATVAEVLLEDRVQEASGVRAPLDGVQLGVLQLVGLAEPGAHRVPLAWRQKHEPDVTVAAAEDRVRAGRRPVARALVAGDLRGADRAEHRVDDLRGRLVAREVDVVAGAGLQRVPVGDQRRPCGLHRRGLQGQLARRHQWLAARQAGAAQHASHGQERRVGRHPVSVGACAAEVRDRDHDEAQIARADVIGAESERPPTRPAGWSRSRCPRRRAATAAGRAPRRSRGRRRRSACPGC